MLGLLMGFKIFQYSSFIQSRQSIKTDNTVGLIFVSMSLSDYVAPRMGNWSHNTPDATVEGKTRLAA